MMNEDNSLAKLATDAAAKAAMTPAELFQQELNALLAKYPTVKLVVQQTITISEKQ